VCNAPPVQRVTTDKARSEEVLVAGTASKPPATLLVASSIVTKWVMGVRSIDSTVRFVCVSYITFTATANNKTAPAVLPSSLSPSPKTPRCSTFNASPLPP